MSVQPHSAARSLRVFGRLDRYVAGLFLASYATAFFLVVGLYLILDMSQHLDEFVEPMHDGSSTPFLLIVRFYLLNVPFIFLQVGPFVTLVAGLFTVAKLTKHNETIAMLGAGVSAQRFLAPVFLFATLLGAGMFGLRETLARYLAYEREALHYVLQEKQYDQVYRGLWLKDQRGSVLHLSEFRPQTGQPPRPEVRGLEAHLFSTSRWITITADRAWYETSGGVSYWRLENGVRQEVERASTREPVEVLEGFDFTPDLALSYYRAGASNTDLSFGEAKELARRDPDNQDYQTLIHYRFTFPLANLVLLLVGLPVLMRHDRRRSAEGLAAACILCAMYFAADLVFLKLGLQGNLEPVLSAWIPILGFGSLGIVLFDSMKS